MLFRALVLVLVCPLVLNAKIRGKEEVNSEAAYERYKRKSVDELSEAFGRASLNFTVDRSLEYKQKIDRLNPETYTEWKVFSQNRRVSFAINLAHSPGDIKGYDFINFKHTFPVFILQTASNMSRNRLVNLMSINLDKGVDIIVHGKDEESTRRFLALNNIFNYVQSRIPSNAPEVSYEGLIKSNYPHRPSNRYFAGTLVRIDFSRMNKEAVRLLLNTLDVLIFDEAYGKRGGSGLSACRLLF